MTTTTVLETVNQYEGTLTEKIADRMSIKPDAFLRLLKNQIISVGRNEPPPTNEELALVMSTMHKYNLDPIVKQVHAFRHKGKMQVMVGIDGWVFFAENQPDFEGVTFRRPTTLVDSPDGKGKKCWEWIEATCHRSGREPYTTIVYLEEWYQNQKNYPSNWQQQTKSRFEAKAYCRAIKMGMGFSVWDDTDKEIMQNNQSPDILELSETKQELLSESIKLEGESTDEVVVEEIDGNKINTDTGEIVTDEEPPFALE